MCKLISKKSLKNWWNQYLSGAIYTRSAITLSLMSLTDFIKILSWYRGGINKNKTKKETHDWWKRICFMFSKDHRVFKFEILQLSRSSIYFNLLKMTWNSWMTHWRGVGQIYPNAGPKYFIGRTNDMDVITCLNTFYNKHR